MGSRRSRVARIRYSIDELSELGVSIRKLTVVTTSVVLAIGGLIEAISVLLHALR
ncbi:MAG: hypothetical protein ACR2MN_13550 [Acidimicrobiales bacterium]